MMNEISSSYILESVDPSLWHRHILLYLWQMISLVFCFRNSLHKLLRRFYVSVGNAQYASSEFRRYYVPFWVLFRKLRWCLNKPKNANKTNAWNYEPIWIITWSFSMYYQARSNRYTKKQLRTHRKINKMKIRKLRTFT